MDKSKLSCHCGCGTCDLDPQLIPTIEKLEALIGYELNVLSGCRCPKHNKDEGGEDHSKHLPTPPCSAVDVESWASNIPKRDQLVTFAKKVGFLGFGYGLSFLHMDLGPKRFWTYPRPTIKHPALLAGSVTDDNSNNTNDDDNDGNTSSNIS